MSPEPAAASAPEPRPHRALDPRIETFAWLLIGVGLLARIVRYAVDRPLWADEALVALAVLERSFGELWTPQPEDPVTPFGFLVLVKLATMVFGEGERALRLVPWLSGLAAFPVYYAVAREALARDEATFALLLFAITEPLVFYSSELKQYASDVLVALLILWPTLRIARLGPGPGRVAAAAAAGSLGIWLSLPAVFVCGGLGVVLLRGLRQPATRPEHVAVALCVAAIAASFALEYVTSIAPHGANAAREGWWDLYYAPLPTSVESLRWYHRAFFGFFNDPLGLTAVEIAALLFALGAIRLYRRERLLLALLGTPIALALLASALHFLPFPTSDHYHLLDRYYPFFGRVILFSVPLAFCILAPGLAFALRFAGRSHLCAGAIVAVMLLGMPVLHLFRNALAPPLIQDMRSLARQMTPLLERGDRVYAQDLSRPVYDYYARRFALQASAGEFVLRTNDDLIPLRKTLATIPEGQRFWYVTLHHPHWQSETERKSLVGALANFAEPLTVVRAPAAHAHLYRARARGRPRADESGPATASPQAE